MKFVSVNLVFPFSVISFSQELPRYREFDQINQDKHILLFLCFFIETQMKFYFSLNHLVLVRANIVFYRGMFLGNSEIDPNEASILAFAKLKYMIFIWSLTYLF